MEEIKYDFGMVGLGVMGRNLLLNIADHGFSIAGLDTDESKVSALKKEAGEKIVNGTSDMAMFISMLKTPRKIMLLVPAGNPVDAVISNALPLLQRGDVIIDGGNSHFTDTNRRIQQLESTGIQFMGVGISGGEEGARFGPSIMPGGDNDSYEKLRPILEAIAAKVNDEPCVTHIGPGSAGHYTKMVHNGIEYGLMQMISETYDVMKRGLKMTNSQIGAVYNSWNSEELQSFLIEISARIFTVADQLTGDGLLVDHILDSAQQKGTGMWTSQSAMDLQVPTPVIDLAVSMRDLSALKKQRIAAAAVLNTVNNRSDGESESILAILKDAAFFSMITIYAQGLHLLRVASEQMNYHIDVAAVARIWRGGCIIRSAQLERIMDAYGSDPTMFNLMVAPYFSHELIRRRTALSETIRFAMSQQIPVPALSASLSYFDAMKSEWLPANLIQAQRDYFGSHTYQRNDREGIFHTKWD